MATNCLYVNPKGREIREFSHSQASEYRESPAKFKWRRVHGWYSREDAATMMFGRDLQEAIAGLYRDRDPVETFTALWAIRKDSPLHYGNNSWEGFNAQGRGLMATLVKSYKDFPIVRPVFFDYKQRQKVRDPHTGVEYAAIPDIISAAPGGNMLIDIKAMGKRIPGLTPGIVINDPQLRTQAAVVGIYRVALWVFVRTPQAPPPMKFEELQAAAAPFGDFQGMVATWLFYQTSGLSWEQVGAALQIPQESVSKEIQSVRRKDKTLKARMDVTLEELQAARPPLYEIQFLDGEMTEQHAKDALRDDLSLVPLIQSGWFPCRCGVRWPNDSAERCPYRGLCLKEATPNATPEQIAVWDAITAENLISREEAAMEGL
jgi:hypothetical protein